VERKRGGDRGREEERKRGREEERKRGREEEREGEHKLAPCSILCCCNDVCSSQLTYADVC
jgi:hypothetical protein